MNIQPHMKCETNLLGMVGLEGDAKTHGHLRVDNKALRQALKVISTSVRLDTRAVTEVATKLNPGSFDELGFAMMYSATFRDAVNLFIHYHRITQQLGKFSFKVVGDFACIEWDCLNDKEPELAFLTEYILLSFCRYAKWLTWRHEFPLIEIHMKHLRAFSDNSAERLFQSEVRYDQEANRIVFDRNFLDEPLQHSDERMLALYKKELDGAFARANPDCKIKDQLTSYLKETLPHQAPVLRDAAYALGFSERQLKRRLNDEETTFREVLYTLRRGMAKSFLDDKNIPLIDVALLLGFEQQSAFTHACKNWFEVSPREYRKRLGGEFLMVM
jgi:AraC-like DNA-binding protein